MDNKKYVVRYRWTSEGPNGPYPYNTKSCIVSADTIHGAKEIAAVKVPEKDLKDFTIASVFGPLPDYSTPNGKEQPMDNNPPTERNIPMKDSTPNATVVPNDEFSKLVTKAYKYDRLVAVLKEHLDDPDDIVMVKDLCLRAESDEKLDELMDAGGFDSYDEMLEEVEAWKNRG